MGKIYQEIDKKICDWIDRQQMFFVATAPLNANGHVNLSPKGHDTLRIIDNHTLAFLDYGGSGIETIAHLRENNRITVMMCAFAGPPKIFRFYGKGEVITPLEEGYKDVLGLFDLSELGLGVRAIIKVKVTRISDSCGFGVPFYDYKAQRATSPNYTKELGETQIRNYLKDNNLQSVDGLPGISEAEAEAFLGPVGEG